MKKGFTLLELLIVVVIIGILAMIAAPSLLNATDAAKEGVVKGNVSAAASSVTGRFALLSSETATQVATGVAKDLNTDSDNPFDSKKSAFGTSSAAGVVTITNNTAGDAVVITGYGRTGTAIITKTIKKSY